MPALKISSSPTHGGDAPTSPSKAALKLYGRRHVEDRCSHCFSSHPSASDVPGNSCEALSVSPRTTGTISRPSGLKTTETRKPADDRSARLCPRLLISPQGKTNESGPDSWCHYQIVNYQLAQPWQEIVRHCRGERQSLLTALRFRHQRGSCAHSWQSFPPTASYQDVTWEVVAM